MEAMEAILSRRSIRKYSKKAIPEDLIKTVLEAAMSAPSAGNEQPWHFLVITDPKILDSIPSFHSHARMLQETSTALLVCGDLHYDKHNGMWIQDCAAAVQNILIAATAHNLGTVWLGVYPRQERIQGLRTLLQIPEHVIPFALIAIGYPAEEKPPAQRYNPQRVRYNRW